MRIGLNTEKVTDWQFLERVRFRYPKKRLIHDIVNGKAA